MAGMSAAVAKRTVAPISPYPMMRQADGGGQGVDGVFVGQFRARQQGLHHQLDLILVRVTGADHSLLDRVRRIFSDWQPVQRSDQGDATRLPQLRVEVGFLLTKVSSMAATWGCQSAMTCCKPSCSWTSRSASEVFGSDATEPSATQISRLPSDSMIPQPVLRRPGSRPIRRMQGHPASFAMTSSRNLEVGCTFCTSSLSSSVSTNFKASRPCPRRLQWCSADATPDRPRAPRQNSPPARHARR